MCEEKPYFPIFVDISEMQILLVGGGKIAQRRVETLRTFARHITVVSPELTETLKEYAEKGEICWKDDFWSIGDNFAKQSRNVKMLMERADMVLAVTNDHLCNEQIAAYCKKQGIPVNVAHRKDLCDFYFPAVAVQGHIVAGISSSGHDHTEVKKVRQKIEHMLGENSDREDKDEQTYSNRKPGQQTCSYSGGNIEEIHCGALSGHRGRNRDDGDDGR